MKLFKRKEIRAETPEQASDPLMDALLGRRIVGKEEALAIPAITSCIDLIAGVVQSLPIKLYEDKNGKVVEVENDERVNLLNVSTGDTLNPSQMWHALIEDYFLEAVGGNVFIEEGLHYIEPGYVAPLKNEDPIYKRYMVNINGRNVFPYQMLRLLRKSKDGVFSTPITADISTFLSATFQEIKSEESSALRGGNKKGFLQAEGKLAEPEMNALKAAFRRLYTNDEEKVLVLNKGMTFKEASDTAREQQLQENKAANMSEIYKLFHIAETVIKGNAQPVDVENTIKFGILPVIETIEASLDDALLKEKEKGKRYFRFDTKKLTRGNIKERYQAYEIGLKNHFLQVDEVRKEEDREPLGIEFIELGLNSVLYDPAKKTVYTPNTDKQTDLEKGGQGID